VSRIYWDSMIFIYLLEGHPAFEPKVKKLHKAMLRRNGVPSTSVFTLGEVLTGPRKRNDAAGIRGIQEFFASDEVDLLPFGPDTANRYSLIRATFRTTQADAIHLASAATAGVDLFVTNDMGLRKLQIPGIRYMMDLDGKVF